MYYRVAIQVDSAPTWQWKSTVLRMKTLSLEKLKNGLKEETHGA